MRDSFYLDRWFSTYTGRWNQSVVENSLSDRFKDEIAAVTQRLSLKPIKGHPKRGTEELVFNDIKVKVLNFSFDEFREVGGDDHNYHTPVFRFEVEIRAKHKGIAQGVPGMVLVYKGEVEVTFPEGYPGTYPIFRLPKYFSFRPAASHTDHMYYKGKMCLYGDTGSGESDWSRRDNVGSAFFVAVKWIAWHELWKKEGVDANAINR